MGLTIMFASLGIGSTSALAAPRWAVDVDAADRVVPGESFSYRITVRNDGDQATDGTAALDVVLPAGIEGLSIDVPSVFGNPLWTCSDPLGASVIRCEPLFPLPVQPGEAFGGAFGSGPFELAVQTDPGVSGLRTASFEISGGGSPTAGNTSHSVSLSTTPDYRITEWDGHIATDGNQKLQAGGHPENIVTTFDASTRVYAPRGALVPESGLRNLTADLPAGFVGSPSSAPTCNLTDLSSGRIQGEGTSNKCPLDSIVGKIFVRFANTPGVGVLSAPIFNMKPSPGEPARFGFNVAGFPNELSANARTDGDLGVQLTMRYTSQGLSVIGATTVFWGVPSDPSHDHERCRLYRNEHGECAGAPGDPVEGPNPSTLSTSKPFLTLPTSCNAPGEGLRFDLAIDGWAKPHQRDSASFVTTKDPPFDDTPIGTTGCDRVPFQPEIAVQPTTDEAETPTGLEVVLTVPPDGLENPTGISQSHLKDAVVYLPEGMTINPSQAEGLAVCNPSQIGLTSGDSRPIRFNRDKPTCPDASQIGEVRLKTPLLNEELTGAAYLAQQSNPTAPGTENPFNSDLALYVAIEGQGILVKLAGEVAPDPSTGQVVTRFLNNPQQPFESFAFKFKGGQRAPLAMPPTCGTHTTKAVLTPWARPNDPVTVTDTFNITKGPNGGPCPSGGVPPFKPGFTAGTINNNASSYSPFVMRLTRNDGEQDMTKFSSVLPPGVVGKLAGLSKCSEAQIAQAKSRNQSGQGRQEISSPSCPVTSRIGRVEAGAGVGSIQTYVGGKIYLAGPYNGAPLSVVVVTPAVAGPFDLGTVVVREALDLNPKTAEVNVDGDASDPIPHILAGIPLRLRDLRVFVDRDNFILNPTSCDESATKATLFGSFLDVLSPSDDVPVALEDRFQAANCANLGFKPKLNLKLTGGTKRGGHPGLRATYVPRKGDANVSSVTVRLPRSAFLDQAHIRTICTRVQFAADNCPKGAQYGYIRAYTPLLDEPLQGPVWLRSSNNKLPDLVFDLKGIVDVEVSTRIDSVRGGIRANVETAPDAPLSKVVLTMQGGKKGLIQNSTNLCKGTNRAEVSLSGHNGKEFESRPVVKPLGCGGKRKDGK